MKFSQARKSAPLFISVFLTLACSMSALQNELAQATMGVDATSVLTSIPIEREQTCVVRTGFLDGALNLRSCAAYSCAVDSVLDEGESLVVLESGAWLKVRTASGATGFVNGGFCRGSE